MFYENIYTSLYDRPTLMYTIIERRIALTELCFYTNEIEVSSQNFSLDATFPVFNGLNNPVVANNQMMGELAVTKPILRQKNIEKLMSSRLKNYIFDSVPNSSNFLRFGATFGMTFVT